MLRSTETVEAPPPQTAGGRPSAGACDPVTLEILRGALDIAAFQVTPGTERPAAGAVRPLVEQEDAVPMLDEELCIAEQLQAIRVQAVRQHDSGAVPRRDVGARKRSTVRGVERHRL